jgi:hypothetical protein
MNIPSVDHPYSGGDHTSDRGIHHPTFREIYEAIRHRDDFNEPQLFYLNRLVTRKLKAFDPRLNADDLELKPYRPSSDLSP